MDASKIVLPSLSSSGVDSVPSQGGLKLPSVQQLMSEPASNRHQQHKYQHPQPQHLYKHPQPIYEQQQQPQQQQIQIQQLQPQNNIHDIQHPRTPVLDGVINRSTSLPSNLHIPTLSSSSNVPSNGLYSPASTENASPLSQANPFRTSSQPQIAYYRDPAPLPHHQLPSQQMNTTIHSMAAPLLPHGYAKKPSTPPYASPSPLYQLPSPPATYYGAPQHPQQNRLEHPQPQVFYQLQSSVPVSANAGAAHLSPESMKVLVPKQASAWSADDDKLLRHLKEDRKLGWRDVATYFPRRTPNACQFRWRRIVSASKSSMLKKNSPVAGRFESKKSSVTFLLNGS